MNGLSWIVYNGWFIMEGLSWMVVDTDSMMMMMVMTILLFLATKTIYQDAAVTAAKFDFDTGVQMHILWNVTLAKCRFNALAQSVMQCVIVLLVQVTPFDNPTGDLRHCWHPGI